MTGLEIRLLGDYQVSWEGRPVDALRPARLQALLSWLVLHAGEPQPRGRLAALLWPDSSDEQARHSLRQALHELRQALPRSDALLRSGQGTVTWLRDGPFHLDVAVFVEAAGRAATFDAVEAALACYGGDLLPDLYDDWVLQERERLQRIRIRLLQDGLRLAENSHAYGEAMECAQRLIQLEPLQEEHYLSLMRLAALSGDRAAALQTYHLCAGTLERELGVEPGEEIRGAYDRLLQRSEQSAVAVRPTIPLIGRDQEVAALQRAWRLAQQGRARAVLVVGEPGVGKTRLLEELAGWVGHRGAAVRTARCYAAEGQLALTAVIGLLRAVPLPAMEPAWLAELTQLLPELVGAQRELFSPQRMSQAWQRNRLFEAAARAVTADGPTLVVVDDLQWADPDTLDWLHYLVRRDPQAQLLVLCTARPEGIGREDRRSALWPDLRASGALDELALGPLGEVATCKLATTVDAGLDAAAALRLYQETEGNPFFVLEMARAENGPGTPRSIQTLLETRLAQLSAEGRQLAQTAAVIGRSFGLPVLLAADQQEERAALRALDELWGTRIIREQGLESYDFTHDKLREAAYASIHSPKRRLLHKRVAEALETVNQAALDEVSAEIAAHFEAAGYRQRAAPFYLRAGDAERRLLANEAALSCYRRALALAPESERVEVILKLADVLQLIGRWTEGESLLRQALEESERSGRPDDHARCLLALGHLLRRKGPHATAVMILEKARDELERLGDRTGLCHALGLLGRAVWEVGDAPRALELLEAQLRLADELGDRRSAGNALGHLGLVHWRQGELASAQSCLEKQCALARAANDQEQLSRALDNLGIMHIVQGRYEQARSCLEEDLEIARSISSMRGISQALITMGVVHRCRGELAAALDSLEQGEKIALDMDDRVTLAEAAHEIGLVAELRGNASAALARYRQAVRLGHETGDRTLGAACISLGRLYEHAGDWPGAIACHSAGAHVALNAGDRFLLGPALGALARTRAAQGCAAEAEALFKRALTSFLPQPYDRCEYALRYAELLFRRGRYQEACRLNQEAGRLATAVGRNQIELASRLLAVRLTVADEATTVRETGAALEAPLPLWPETFEHEPPLPPIPAVVAELALDPAEILRRIDDMPAGSAPTVNAFEAL